MSRFIRMGANCIVNLQNVITIAQNSNKIKIYYNVSSGAIFHIMGNGGGGSNVESDEFTYNSETDAKKVFDVIAKITNADNKN
jgi:hypothetical protein